MPNENNWFQYEWQKGDIVTKGKMNRIENQINNLTTEITDARNYGGGTSNSLGKRIDNIDTRVIVATNGIVNINNEINNIRNVEIINKRIQTGYYQSSGESYLISVNVGDVVTFNPQSGVNCYAAFLKLYSNSDQSVKFADGYSGNGILISSDTSITAGSDAVYLIVLKIGNEGSSDIRAPYNIYVNGYDVLKTVTESIIKNTSDIKNIEEHITEIETDLDTNIWNTIIKDDTLQRLYGLVCTPKTASTDIDASVMLKNNCYYLVYNSDATMNSLYIDIRNGATVVQLIKNYGQGGATKNSPAIFKFNGDSGIYTLHITLGAVYETTDDEVTKWILVNATSGAVDFDVSLGAYGNMLKSLGYITPQMFGAVANGTVNCREQIQAAINYAEEADIGEIVFPDGIYYVDNNEETGVSLELSSNIIFRGIGHPKIICNAVYSLIHAKSNYSIQFDGISIESADGAEETSAFFRVTTSNVTGVEIKNTNTETKGYGVLVDRGSDGGKHLLVTGNKIHSQRDAIEINSVTPINATEEYNRNGRFKDSIITNNILNSSGGTYSIGYGFGIGIAAGKNVVTGMNISDASKREGFHVEDGSEKVIAVGNVFDNCSENGAKFHTNAPSDEQPIMIGNAFKHNGDRSTYAGFINAYSNTSHRTSMSIGSNQFDNFAYGIQIQNDSIAVADGCITRGCLYAVNLSNGDLHGTVIAENCNQLVRSTGMSKIDFISSLTHAGANCIDVVNGRLFVRKGLLLTNISTQQKSTNEYPTISFCKQPMFFDGYAIIKFFSDNATSLKSYIILKCTIEDGTLTKSIIDVSSAMAYLDITGGGLKLNGGYLAYQFRLIYSQQFVLNAQIELDGHIIF